MKRFLPLVITIGAAALVMGIGMAAQAKKGPSFAKEVHPLIKSNCLPCHLEENENPSGLAMDDYERLMKGGNHEKTVVAGKPKESNLYLKLLPKPPFGKQMARNRKKLSDEEVKIVYDWIEAGAKKD
ncbi:MAG: c-type cytochrome domain-containing protein [Bacteroidota bacterium]